MIEIPILSPGRKTSSNGQVVEMDNQLLDDVVSTYDPAQFKAPLIVSHNTSGRDDVPLADSELAYGYPSALKRVGDRIVALFDRVSPVFREWWQNGQLLSVSPSLYRPESPNNPYPGRWSLRHVAALGKSPPAQKDLGQPVGLKEFEQAQSLDNAWVLNLAEFDLPEESDTVDLMAGSILSMVLRNLREFFLVERGQELADRIIPEYAINQASIEYLPEELLMPEDDFECGKKKKKSYLAMAESGQSEAINLAGEPMPNETQAGQTADFNELERKLAVLEAQNKALEERLAAEAHKARMTEITSFCEQHRGRLTFDPTSSVDLGESSSSLVDFMAGLDDSELNFMKSFIETIPFQTLPGELATDFSEPAPKQSISQALLEARQSLQAMYDSNRNGGN